MSPPLDGAIDVDVAVVGGGYTGLWTALALREREPSLAVALLEAREIGDGPSGRNGGFLHGYWSSLPTLRRVLGDGARAAARARVEPGSCRRCARSASAAARTSGSARAGCCEVSAGASEDAGGRARRRGRDASSASRRRRTLLDEGEARRRLSTRRASAAACLFRDGATVQPARLALALRRAAIASGVQLFERHARDARPAPDRLETPTGVVRAREIVLALNVWGTSWPLGGRQTNFGSAVVLTEPVPELLEEIGWTGGEAIIDGRMFLHYFRTTPDGRVLMGSGSGRLGLGDHVGPGILDDVPAQARAERGLRELLPALAAAPIAARWSGPIDVSADKLPRFGTVPGTRLHFGAGYSGNGVGPSWLGGQILASLALGARDEWTALPLVDRQARRLPPEPFRYVGGKLVRWGTLASEEAAAAGRRPPAAARAAAAIPRLLRMPIGTR